MNYLELALYGILLVGIYLSFYQAFHALYVSYKLSLEAKKMNSGEEEAQRTSDEMTRHIEMLLKATIDKDGKNAVNMFFVISGGIGFVVFILLNLILPIGITLLATIGSMFVPYMLLRTKLQTQRVSISREGEILITEILNNYKINHYNMSLAIEETAKTIVDAPNSKKLMYDLAKGLNVTSAPTEVKKLLDAFRFSTDTTWANILATNIYFAHVQGIKVTTSLADLTDSIAKARKVLEHSKRENNESVMMLKYLVPICMVLTVVGSIKYFDFTLSKFIQYQFGTPTGVTWFLIVIAFYLVGIFITAFLSRRKMDL